MKASFKVQGRLGNYLFQAFTTYAYAKKHGLDFVLPNHEYSRHFDLPVENLNNCVVVNEESHRYKEPIFVGSDTVLCGYFQSPLYFDEYRDKIRDAFGFSKIFLDNTVAIHVRRGDYLQYPNHHPVATLDYFKKAIDVFCLMDKKDLQFSIFSDDIGWCKANMGEEFWDSFQYMYDYDFVEQDTDVSDMLYMGVHEHYIISNSTYSYIPAYLGSSPNKIVVCPHEDNHFGESNKHLDVSDYYPKNQEWIKIKY